MNHVSPAEIKSKIRERWWLEDSLFWGGVFALGHLNVTWIPGETSLLAWVASPLNKCWPGLRQWIVSLYDSILYI